MALAAKMPWYHSTGNRDEGFESSSSASLLHSIYGSQASQLLFSSSSGYIGSESSLSAAATAERGSASPAAVPLPTPSSQALQRTRLQQRRARPNSSPVSVIVSRAQRRSVDPMAALTVRKTSIEQYDSEAAALEDPDRISAAGLPLSPPPKPIRGGGVVVLPLSPPLEPIRGGGVVVTDGGGRSPARRPASAAAVAGQRRPPSASQVGGQRRASYTRPKTAIGIVSPCQ